MGKAVSGKLSCIGTSLFQPSVARKEFVFEKKRTISPKMKKKKKKKNMSAKSQKIFPLRKTILRIQRSEGEQYRSR